MAEQEEQQKQNEQRKQKRTCYNWLHQAAVQDALVKTADHKSKKASEMVAIVPELLEMFKTSRTLLKPGPPSTPGGAETTTMTSM